MANILLTNRCFRKCPYCFAQESMDGPEEKDNISWENLIYLADLFYASNEFHMSLLGGEPTLHPEFTEIVKYLYHRGFSLSVFTSGVMSSKRLQHAVDELGDALEKKRLSFVCNINEPKDTPANEAKAQEAFLDAFGSATVISFNIYHPNFDVSFAVDLIKKYDLRRHIRVGVANPIPGYNNEHIALHQFRPTMERLVSFVPMLEKERIDLGLDCGFTSCSFTDEEIGKLARLGSNVGSSVKFSCGAALDFGPDMQVWHCFPLANIHRRSVYEFDSLQEIKDYFTRFNKEVRKIAPGVFDDCSSCVHMESGHCQGGCLAHIIRNHREEFDKIVQNITQKVP